MQSPELLDLKDVSDVLRRHEFVDSLSVDTGPVILLPAGADGSHELKGVPGRVPGPEPAFEASPLRSSGSTNSSGGLK